MGLSGSLSNHLSLIQIFHTSRSIAPCHSRVFSVGQHNSKVKLDIDDIRTNSDHFQHLLEFELIGCSSFGGEWLILVDHKQREGQ